MSNHTPGPWQVIRRTKNFGECKPGIWIRGKDRQTVFDSDALDVLPLSEADAALIAAAPDLLDACEAVMEFLANGTPVNPGALVQAEVFNAIVKAKGKT